MSHSHLSPAQSSAYARLREAIEVAPFVMLEGAPGSGKSRLASRLVEEVGGLHLNGRDLSRAASGAAHPCLEEQLHALLENALREHDLVVVDDFQETLKMARAPGYDRPRLIAAPILDLVDTARASGKCLVLVGETFWTSSQFHLASTLAVRASNVEIPPLDARDVAFFLELGLGAKAREMDAERVFQYAPSLNVYQLDRLCRLLERSGKIDEASLRDIIDTRLLKTNLHLNEVAHITFADLKGFEPLLDKLTTFVINPLRQEARFEALRLKPKRGVLLYGPPGTGKTSIGRALAHQMKGKFFMIDGTIPPEPASAFFGRIKQVFEAAKAATPSVIFIDDADVLFQSDRSTSLNRYLLTMLDGLESQTAGKVAVIMTAMDPNHMPPPLLRSGRVELWLETKPPATQTRAEMIVAHVRALPAQFRECDPDAVAALTKGFNAADMRRIVADVKALYAADVIDGRKPGSIHGYFVTSIEAVRRNKELLALAASGEFDFNTTAGGGRSETERKQSRLRDEMNSCAGE
jgi:transitional endoplasmic reticulum ATPase